MIKLLKLKQLSIWAMTIQWVGKESWGHALSHVNTQKRAAANTMQVFTEPMHNTHPRLHSPVGSRWDQGTGRSAVWPALLARTAGPTFELRPPWVDSQVHIFTAHLHCLTTRQDAQKTKVEISKESPLPRDFALNTWWKCPMGPREAEGADASSQKNKQWANPWSC